MKEWNRRLHPQAEAVRDPANAPELEEGRRLFNQGKHWHAHEAWEHLWLGLEGDDKVFVQGLIMAAAMLVQYGKRIDRGVENHYRNATSRLEVGLPSRWGIDTASLVTALGPFREAAAAARWELDPLAVQVTRFRHSSQKDD